MTQSTLPFSLDDFVAACSEIQDFTKKEAFEPGAELFIRGFYNDASENEYLGYTLSDHVGLARDFWMVGDCRKPGETLLRLKSASEVAPHLSGTLIQIVTDDKAFLVDSLTSQVSRFGVDVLGLFHPIIDGFRSEEGFWRDAGTTVSESMILIILPTQSSRRCAELKKVLNETLKDVEIINQDFESLVAEVRRASALTAKTKANLPADVVDEAVTFLDWIADGNFVLLGARNYRFQIGKDNAVDFSNPEVDDGASLGVLRDPKNLVLRQSSEPSVIASNTKAFFANDNPVTVEKSNLFSRVHRLVRMDYISVKHFKAGQLVGETRFVGLFTSAAYSRDPEFVPLIRQKVANVIARSDFAPASHSAKALANVLSTYPRDELFQISEDDLFRISVGVAQAFDRPRARLFVRHDPYKRFVSALVYVPRENYNTRVRQKIGARLSLAFEGRVSAFYPQYSDSPMARVHYIIGLDPGSKADPDLKDLETEIAAITQPWFESVKNAAEDSGDDMLSAAMTFEHAFSPAYQAAFDARETVADITALSSLSKADPIHIRAYTQVGDNSRVFRAKLYSFDARISPSRIMPLLSHFNLHVAQETGYAMRCHNKPVQWVHDFEMTLDFEPADRAVLNGVFENAFMATWTGLNEDDAFNSLILPLAVNWRDIAFLRLLASYRRQSGVDLSARVQLEALTAHPSLTKALIDLKTVKFDPSAFKTIKARKAAVEEILEQIETDLKAVTSLAHDRAIRRMASVLKAALRTNFYQVTEDGTPKVYICLKIASRNVIDLPRPVPYREIFISSPEVEGVHLRFGPVARGGLRWSDRADDFRTEVLGLVKAQQVKNSVIVPVGSKGGFVPKQLPVDGSRDDVRNAAISAYKVFIASLLDVTDNYQGEEIVTPGNVVCWDAPDPYLVVAADKGTATFSDIANQVSADYDFWLGDAFASGGSVGYDHKAMGITARGAWEAVKRHFREIGKDIQSEDFTVIGCGDMSGDVFGNGMLLSEHTRLIAAFDHRDIFIDPDPNAKKSHTERKRLFEMVRSSWQDYDTKLISKGGGVFSRAAKSIELSEPMKVMTGLKAESVTPDELIYALLKAETELLWFGGIGTYIKSSDESHSDVGNKANDVIRVNGSEVKAKVVGEGANLGVTQAGRIEFAMRGGRINTDAIDNAAGVDTSDNEVNIKILLGGAIEAGEIKEAAREDLLEHMTATVAGLVLQHNYDQTGALSLAAYRAKEDHGAFERLMVSLEKSGDLVRDVEGLPDTQAMKRRSQDGKYLTRPEIAVLLAYAKNRLVERLGQSDIPDDSYAEDILRDYFPSNLHGFEQALAGHRLRREIILSRVTNDLIDIGGPLFVMRLQERTDSNPDHIAKAFLIARDTLGVDELRTEIAAMDNKIPAEAQLQLHDEIMGVLRRVTAWLVRRNVNGSLGEEIAARKGYLAEIDDDWLKLLSPYDQKRAEQRIKRFEKAGIPKSLATNVALLRSRASGFDVIALSQQTQLDFQSMAALFYRVGSALRIDRIRAAILSTDTKSHWDTLAFLQLEEDFFVLQSDYTLTFCKWQSDKEDAILETWLNTQKAAFKTYESVIKSMMSDGAWTSAKLSIAASRLRELLQKYR